MNLVKVNESKKITMAKKTAVQNVTEKFIPGWLFSVYIKIFWFFYMPNPSFVWKAVKNKFNMLLNNHTKVVEINIQALTGST